MGNTFSWNGGNGDFSVAANWTDTSGSTPAPPTATDMAGLFGNGSTITGTGTVGLLQIGGSGPWTLAGDFVLAGETEPTSPPFAFWVTNDTTLASGTTLDASGGTTLVGASRDVTLDVAGGAVARTLGTFIGQLAGDEGTLFVSGAGASWHDVANTLSNDGSIVIGVNGSVIGVNGSAPNGTPGGRGHLVIANGATVTEDTSATLGSNGAGAEGDATVSGGSQWSIGTNITIGYAGAGSVAVLSGSQVATHGGFDQMGGAPTGSGTLTVDGAGSSFTSGAGNFTVGNGGTAALIVSNAATFASAGALGVGGMAGGAGSVAVNAATLTVGAYAVVGGSGNGTAVITGKSTVSVAGALTVGANGDGSLEVAGGAMSVAGGFQLGAFAGGGGSLDVSNGASFTETSLLDVGNGGSGAITVNGGTLNAEDGLFIGNFGAGSGTVAGGAVVSVTNELNIGISAQGSLALTDGVLTTSGTADDLGGSADATGSLTVSGAGAIFHSGSGAFYIGNGGSGALAVAAGTVTTGATSMGIVAGGVGSASVTSGGTWSLSASLTLGYAGDGTVAITSGGQVSTGPGFDQIGGVADSSGTLGVSGAGSRFSSGASSLTAGTSGDAVVNVADGGVLSTAGALTFAGDSGAVATGLVSGGTVVAGGGLVLGASGIGSVLVSDGGTLASNGTFDQIGGSAGGSGTLGVSGAGSAFSSVATSVSVGNAGDAAISVEDGALFSTAGVLYFATGGGSVATGVVAGGTLLAGNGLLLGAGGVGSLLVSAGGTVAVTGLASIAAAAGAQGSVADVTGAGALWQISRGLVVGEAAAGSLLVAAGGTVTAGNLYVGLTGASGVINVQGTGSLLSIAGAGTLGDGGAAALVLGNGGSVHVGGTLVIGSDGTVVAQGGSLDPALIVNYGVIGGVGTVIGDIDNAGTITASKGQLVLTGSVDGSGGTLSVGAGATLLAAGTVAAGQTISFADATGTLALGITGNIDAAPIAGFTAGDQIVIHGQVTATASYDPVANTLSLFGDGGTPVGMLQFTGTHTASDFSDAVTAQAACYAAGTRIATRRGYVPVEQLQIGDRVLLACGGTAPITWLGHRRVACRRHPRPHDVQPICVRRGAFGPNRPRRDLHLSPDHAVAIDGVLIPIRYLVNGATIVRQDVATVEYWHVELPAHGVILAEGLPAESYLDTGNRAAFVEGGAALQLHPEFARRVWSGRACAELVLAGPRLRAARRTLLSRAAALGHRTTGDAELNVLADGRVLPAIVEGNVRHVRIPATATRIRLASRRWVPGETRADADDSRVLGVALSGMRLDGQSIALDDARLTSGWHAPEAGFRWTDGDAGLALAGVRTLSIAVALTGTYWARRARYSRRTISMSSCTEVSAAARS